MNKYDYVVKAIRYNKMVFDEDNNSLNISTSNILVQFQDRLSNLTSFKSSVDNWGMRYISGKYDKSPRVSTCTWCRIWIDNELVFNINDSKYVARDKAIKYLKGL